MFLLLEAQVATVDTTRNDFVLPTSFSFLTRVRLAEGALRWLVCHSRALRHIGLLLLLLLLMLMTVVVCRVARLEAGVTVVPGAAVLVVSFLQAKACSVLVGQLELRLKALTAAGFAQGVIAVLVDALPHVGAQVLS